MCLSKIVFQLRTSNLSYKNDYILTIYIKSINIANVFNADAFMNHLRIAVKLIAQTLYSYF